MGAADVVGFYYGIEAYEHVNFRSTMVAYCNTGIRHRASAHPNTGVISIENCNYSYAIDAGNGGLLTGYADVLLRIENGAEAASTGAWWTPTTNIYSANSGNLVGIVKATAFTAGSVNAVPVTSSTFTGLTIQDLSSSIWTDPTSGQVNLPRKTTMGSAVIPATNTTTTYPGLWFPNNCTVWGETDNNFANIALRTNWARTSGGTWAYGVNGAAWALTMGHGSSFDAMTITRAPSGTAGDNVSSASVTLFNLTSTSLALNVATTTLGGAASAANTIAIGTSGIVAEGSSADANETTISFENPTAKRAYRFANVPTTTTVDVVAALTKTDTGDPASGYEGQIVINTFDNTAKIYAEGAWRAITTPW